MIEHTIHMKWEVHIYNTLRVVNNFPPHSAIEFQGKICQKLNSWPVFFDYKLKGLKAISTLVIKKQKKTTSNESKNLFYSDPYC